MVGERWVLEVVEIDVHHFDVVDVDVLVAPIVYQNVEQSVM
jgi:hypothetical protein